MVIKPHADFDKPGIEFGLTYFDDPGVNIPSTVASWVAMTGERIRKKYIYINFYLLFYNFLIVKINVEFKGCPIIYAE